MSSRKKDDHSKSGRKKHSLDEALRRLEEAARKDGEDFREILEEGFDRFRDFLKTNIPDWDSKSEEVKEFISKSEARFHETVDEGRKKFKEADKKAHENPWMFAGGAAVVGLIIGWMIGKSGKR